MTLKVRYSDFTTVTRSASRAGDPSLTPGCRAARRPCWPARTRGGGPVRLLGVSVHSLVGGRGRAAPAEAADPPGSRFPMPGDPRNVRRAFPTRDSV